ncbi:MAG: hypothetical protein IKO23_09455 [Bacteroidales bacterium]|nr:hypothetical protein [Bacteroidales bacterium]
MKRISINGKEYPCRITMGAMLRFKRETGKDVSELKETDVAELVTFLWCCIASASKADDVEFGMSLMDFADMLDPETLKGFYTSMEKEESADPEKKTGQPTS